MVRGEGRVGRASVSLPDLPPFFFSLTLKNLTTSATVPVMPSMFSSGVLGMW
jgi:hypothetical protein